MQDRVDEEESQRKLNQEYIDNDPFHVRTQTRYTCTEQRQSVV
jgi:hypothetical protein